MLLQVLDDGFLTDSLGRKIDFTNCVIIMTSNLGVKKIQDFGSGVGFGTTAKKSQEDTFTRKTILKSLQKKFAPEFLMLLLCLDFVSFGRRKASAAVVGVCVDRPDLRAPTGRCREGEGSRLHFEDVSC